MKNKKLLIYIILVISYVVFSISFFKNNGNVGFILNRSQYLETEYSINVLSSCNDCIISEDGQIEFTGEDPYIYMPIQMIPVGPISIELFDEYDGSYQIYYAMDGAFTEEQSVKSMEDNQHVFSIGETINSIRLDFVGKSVGEKVVLSENAKVVLNGEIEKFIEKLSPFLFVGAVYIIVSIVYMLYLQGKNRVVGMVGAYVYSLVVVYLGIDYMAKQMDMNRMFLFFVIACLGMFFWGNSMNTEEMKWKKE